MIKLELYKQDGNKLDITKLITSLTWSGDYKSCSRKLEFATISNDTDKNIPKVDIPLSSLVVLLEDNKELFRGFIFDRELTSSGTSINYTAYDYAERLNKIKVSYNIKDLTPTQIANKFLDDYKLSKGNIVTSTVKVKKIFIGVSAYEMIMTTYTEQSKKDNKKYMIRSVGDKFEVIEKGNITLTIGFEEGKNIISSNFKESIENMVNKVLIVDDSGNKKSEVTDDNLLKIHGLFQEVYKKEDGKDSTIEAKAMLQGVDKTCSLSGFGDSTCVTGMGVQVKDSYTGLVGLFYIDTDTHTWDSRGNHTVDLDLNFINIMNEVSVGEDEQNENSSSSNSSISSEGGNSDLVSIAKKYLGIPYVWGGSSPKGFDCSGFTQYCYKQIGINIPRTSSEQSKSGQSVSRNNLHPGDLVFFSTNGTGKVSHVGMYIGDGNMIHAPKPGDKVKIASINSSYYTSKFVNARRYY